jgi:hypothetical protein
MAGYWSDAGPDPARGPRNTRPAIRDLGGTVHPLHRTDRGDREHGEGRFTISAENATRACEFAVNTMTLQVMLARIRELVNTELYEQHD